MSDLEQIKAILSNHGYEYLELIGRGSFAEVYLCESKKYFDTFAVKRVIHQNCQTQSEYDALIHLDHPYIIKLYEIFEEDESQYLVMEYCPNNTLKNKGKLDYNQFLYYSKQILEALLHCHSRKIAHRDIKPENIFLDKYNRTKLADFGLSKQFDKETITYENCGSLMYCSPEIVNKQPYNPFKADIWALGITFFFLITGKYPFPHHSQKELVKVISLGSIDYSNVHINHKIKSLIQKMTNKIPNNRPNIDELLNLPMYNEYMTNPLQKVDSIAAYSLKNHANGINTQSHKLLFSKSSDETETDDNNCPLTLANSHICRTKITQSNIFRNIICRPSFM